ncbi:MAG: hypothetical protein KF850_02895 [Labilithrix sp.]|nr:hypothetical protein [Labilithrix sp.]
MSGVTFRQRETKHLESSLDAPVMNGVVEVQWPGATTFKTILGDSSQAARAPMTATLIQLGGAWLVERRLTLSGEGLFGEGADAVLCDLSAKNCTE